MTKYWEILTLDTLENEIWNPIPIDWLYGFGEISNLGRVKIFGRSYKNAKNRWYTQPEYIKKQTIGSNGYPQVLIRLDGKIITRRTHRLIAMAFIPNPNNYEQINHINSIRTDCRLENLEWCTQSQNQIHSYYVNKRVPNHGIRNGKSKITDKQALEIFNSQVSSIILGNRFNMSAVNINRIKRGVTWKHITMPT